METLDKFTPKKTSYNTYGIRKASGETKHRIIFAGHADSSMEWRFSYLGGPKLLIATLGGAVLGLVYSLVASVVVLVKSYTDPAFITTLAVDILSYIMLFFIIFFITAILMYDKKRVVEGANDDLTGCFTSIAVLKFMQDNDIRLENTEVVALCTGSEETGLRGAKDFIKKHGEEFSDVETIFIALDTIRDYDFMGIYNKDMSGIVKNDPEVCNIAGLENLPYLTVSLGATDAAAISKSKKMKAAAFAAMDPAPARYYHTRLDTHENLDLKTIEAGVGLCLETAFLYDEKGLNV